MVDGGLSQAWRLTRDTLADCPTWRTLVGASGDEAQTQARNRIHRETLPGAHAGHVYKAEELKALRPYAVVMSGGLDTSYRSTSANGFDFSTSGTVTLVIEAGVPVNKARFPAKVAEWIEDDVLDPIIVELRDLAGRGGYLAITNMRFETGEQNIPWFRTDPKDVSSEGDAAMAILTIEYGRGE